MYGLIDCNNFFVSCERAFNPRLEHRPVAVLSNNDGCVVARSPEFKALGIPMGTPYFKLRPLQPLHHLVFLSSNYELYADLSNRVMSIIREYAPTLEQYSIDEAFIKLELPKGQNTPQKFQDFGRRLRQIIRQWVGIPTGVGFAPTRTLAKVATHVAKSTPQGVFVMPEDPTDILQTIPLEDVWGIGHRFNRRLMALGFRNAAQLAQANPQDIRRKFNVCLARTVLELQGTPAIPLETAPQPLQTVTCSRTFGTPITTLTELKQAFMTYATTAAERLREQRQTAAGATLFIQVADPRLPFNHPNQFAARQLCFPKPTTNTSEIIREIMPTIESLFRPGLKHKKCGVMYFGLEHEVNQQLELFQTTIPPPIPDQLYHAVDLLNRQLGPRTVFTAGEGLLQPWKMKRGKLSRRFTTSWDDLLNVH